MKNEILAKDPEFDNERFAKWKRALKSEGEDGCGDVEAAEKLFLACDQDRDGFISR